MKKIFLLIMLLVANISAAQAKNISATFFLNGEVFDQFAQEDVEITLEKFSATTCRLHLKNNLDFKFRPRVKVRFVENWGNKFEDKKTLPPVEVGKAIDFDIEMKNYSVTRRKNTTAWLQIWLDGDRLISEDAETAVWQKIQLDGERLFNEHYFCVKFDFQFKDSELDHTDSWNREQVRLSR